MKWYLKVIKNYLGFSGRARRTEYWMFVLINTIFLTIARIIDHALGTTLNTNSLYGSTYAANGYINTFYSLVVFLPSLAVMVRRLHDVGKSGWLILYLFLGAIGLVMIASFFTAGSGGALAFIMVASIIGAAIWFLVLLCTDSEPGVNKYGPNPKDTGETGTPSGEALDSEIKI